MRAPTEPAPRRVRPHDVQPYDRATGPMTGSAFEELAAELAAHPGLIERLLADHDSNDRGYCRGCTTGGTGTHSVPAPCPLRRVAEYAAEQRRRRCGSS